MDAASNFQTPRLHWRRLAFLLLGPIAAGAAVSVAASIGEKGRVSEQDLADFTASESCYGPDALNSRKAGFMRMLETAIMEEVMHREAGLDLKGADYEKEASRVDRETRAPDILECVKKYFSFEKGVGFKSADGRRRYERVFLRKNMIAGPFHRFIQFDPQVQREAYRIKDEVQVLAQHGESFADLAKMFKLNYSTRTYTLEEPKEDKKGWSPFEKQFIEDHLQVLSPGQMRPEPLDSYDIQFLRLLSSADGKYRFESLHINKKGGQDYLRSIPKLRCVIVDPELKGWLQGIRGNPMLTALDIE